MQIRQMSGATEFQINMKSGVWFTSLYKNVRFHSALKVLESPDPERHAKRMDVGSISNWIKDCFSNPKMPYVTLDPLIFR